MKSHIYRLIHTRLSYFSIFIIIFLPCIEIIQLKMSGQEFSPPFAFFLTGSSRGHFTQIILLWFLPLYFLLLGSDDIIQDHKTGVWNIFISKMGKKKYFLDKFIHSFVISFGVMFSSLILNLILVSIFFKNGTSSKGFFDEGIYSDPLLNFSSNHPYVAILLFSIVCCILAGFAGLLGAALSLFFLDKKYVYTASFFIWFFLILRDDSLMFLFQPFAEYGLNTLIPIFLVALAILAIIPILIYVYEVNYNNV